MMLLNRHRYLRKLVYDISMTHLSNHVPTQPLAPSTKETGERHTEAVDAAREAALVLVAASVDLHDHLHRNLLGRPGTL